MTDANILFAALIRDNVSRRLLVSKKLVLYAPAFILEELEKYKDEIVQQTAKSAADFEAVMAMLRKRITLVPLKQLIQFLQKAEIIAPDEKDVAYIALALKLKVPIWSNDRALKQKQTAVTVCATEEILRLLVEQP